MSNSAQSDQLRLLGPHGDGESIVDLILVPGIGTPPVEEWAITSKQLETFLISITPRPRLLAFDPKVSLNDNFSIGSYLDQGEVLLQRLVDLQGGFENTQISTRANAPKLRRLAFMCHSLGGFILKRALCMAHARSQKYGFLLCSILGIIFLGVPHMASDSQALPEKSLLILNSVPKKFSRQASERINDSLKVLVEISRLFQDIELHVKILSIFELTETKVKTEKRRFIRSYHKLILLEEEHIAIGSTREERFGIEAAHGNLIQLGGPNKAIDKRILESMSSIFGSEGHSAVEQRLESLVLSSTSPVPSLTSLSSYDAARIALASEPTVLSHAAVRSGEPYSDKQTTGSTTLQSWELVPTVTSLPGNTLTAQLPCFMVDLYEKNKEFFGREKELNQLDEFLLPTKNMPFSGHIELRKHVTVYGMGGLGKTSIAIEFAHSRRSKFHAVFWIRADEISKLENDFGQIASVLGLEDPGDVRDPVVSRNLAKAWLSNPRRVLSQAGDIISQAEASWLLIFDNADEPGILQDYWPMSSNGSILVTSRDPLSRSSPSIATHCIDLNPFTIAESVSLLQRLSYNDNEEEAAIQVALKLGGLPLAISQMAAVIRHQYLSYSDFLERYEDEADHNNLFGVEVETPRLEARGNIASVFAIERLEPQAKTILQLCSMLDPDCIQERIFREGASSVDLDDFPKNLSDYHVARAGVLKSSLLRRNTEKKEFWVHRIVQDAVRAKMSKERTDMIFLTAVSLVYAAWGTASLVRRHDMTLMRSREGLFPHAQRLKSIYEKSYMNSEPEHGVQLASLLSEAGWWQHERGNSHDIKPFLTLALQICEQNVDKDMSQILGDIHYGLTAVANETNDGQACLTHSRIFLEMRLKVFESSGFPDVRLAIAHNEIGIAWVMNGSYDDAISAFERSIEVYKSLEDYWPAMDTNPRTNLGFTYWVTDRLDQAYTVLEDLLQDREAKFGVDDSESYRTGRVFHGLGNVRFSQGFTKDSDNLHNRALAHYLKVYGYKHHKTADLCHRVAQNCMRNGDLQTAARLIDRALQVYRLRAIYAPERARTTFLKAKLFMSIGKEEEAALLFKEAKTLRKNISGASKIADSNLREADFDNLVTFFSR